MKGSSLRWLLGAAFALLVGLLASGARAADMQRVLEYVPPDAFAVAGIDVDKVRSATLVRKIQELLLQEPEARKNLGELRKAVGFDPFRDIHSLVVAFPPEVTKDDDQFLLVGEAKIDEARLIAFAQKQGAPIHAANVAGGKIYLLGSQDDGALAVRGNIVIIGAKAVVERALGKKGPSPALAALLAQVSSRPMFVAVEPTLEVRSQLGRELRELSELKRAAAGGDLVTGISVDGIATFTSPAAAQRVEKAAKEALRAARQEVAVKQLGFGAFLDGLSVQAAGPDLKVKLTVSAADLDSMQRKLGVLLGAGSEASRGAPPPPAPGKTR